MAEPPRAAWPQASEGLAERFDDVTPYLVGLEDEVMLLDPDGLGLAHRAGEVLAMTGGDSRFKLELPASQLEIMIAPEQSVRAAADSLLGARRALAAATEGSVQVAGAGAHPFSPGIGMLNGGERYARIAETYRCLAQRELVCALQVHVSPGHSKRALAVYNAARSYLPLVAALAANAPLYEGRDTGLASVRPKVATLLPRQGVPPPIADWQEFGRMLSWGSAAGTLENADTWWWELRLHAGFGTLEFRVPDAQSTVGEAAAIAAVIQSLVASLGARHDAGEPLPVQPTWMIDENRWSACRDGVAGEMTELETGHRRPTRALLEALFEQLEPAAASLHASAELARASVMAESNGAIQQREVANAGGPSAVARWLTERFLNPLDG